MDVRRRCLFTIKCLHLGFQWDVENLKRAKSTLDLEILKKADVIGMTTTGKCNEDAPSLKFIHILKFILCNDWW